jgi:hypothetical protein
MKKVRILILSAVMACALSIPAMGGIASANQNGNNQNGNPQQPCQNGTIINGQCVQGH